MSLEVMTGLGFILALPGSNLFLSCLLGLILEVMLLARNKVYTVANGVCVIENELV